LPLGVAKWRLTWGLAVWHGFDRRYVTLCNGRWLVCGGGGHAAETGFALSMALSR
jgi:hypothetical protein